MLFFFFFNDTATTEIYTSDTLFPYTTLFRSGGHGLSPMFYVRVRPGLHRAGQRLQAAGGALDGRPARSEEHTSELQSLMRISYAVFCLKKKTNNKNH